MSDVDDIAKILVEELEAGGAHAKIVARAILEKILGDGASGSDEELSAEVVGNRCVACGQAVPEFEEIACDDDRCEIRVGDAFVTGLTGSEFALFRLLLDARGRTLSKEAILNGLYAIKAFADGDVPEAKIVDVFVCKLRKKIAPLGIDLSTSWGRGYALRGKRRDAA